MHDKTYNKTCWPVKKDETAHLGSLIRIFADHVPSTVSSLSRWINENPFHTWWTWLQIRGGYPHNIFLISWRKHMLWVLIRSSQRGASDEYPQHMFSLKNKKEHFSDKKAPYLLLCTWWTYRLIWVFAGHTGLIVGFVVGSLIFICLICFFNLRPSSENVFIFSTAGIKCCAVALKCLHVLHFSLVYQCSR